MVSGIAANEISGFSLTENYYALAVSILKERFGRQDMFVDAHLQDLLNIECVKSSSDTRGWINLYNKWLVQIPNLELLSGINYPCFRRQKLISIHNKIEYRHKFIHKQSKNKSRYQLTTKQWFSYWINGFCE